MEWIHLLIADPSAVFRKRWTRSLAQTRDPNGWLALDPFPLTIWPTCVGQLNSILACIEKQKNKRGANRNGRRGLSLLLRNSNRELRLISS